MPTPTPTDRGYWKSNFEFIDATGTTVERIYEPKGIKELREVIKIRADNMI